MRFVSAFPISICMILILLSFEKKVFANNQNDSTAVLELPGLNVTQKKSGGLPQNKLGRTRFLQKDLKVIPASTGDALRAASNLPGITNSNDFNAQASIRGGEGWETAVYLNSIPLLQPWHFGSVFSILNQQSVHSVDVYTDQVPSFLGNSLSGAFDVRGGGARLDSGKIVADLSLLKGSASLELPLIRKHLAISLAFNRLWYEESAKTILNAAAGDSAFDAEMREYRKYVNLPSFSDYQLGLSTTLNQSLSIHYTGIFANDIQNITLPSKSNIFTHRALNIFPESNPFPSESFRTAEKVGLDSLSKVRLLNQVHIVTLPYQYSHETNWVNSLAFQNQAWDVAFSDVENLKADEKPEPQPEWYSGIRPSGFLQNRHERQLDWNSQIESKLNDEHHLITGFSLQWRESQFQTELPEALLQLIENNRINLLTSLPAYGEEGYSIERINPQSKSTDILGDLARRIHFSLDDYQETRSGALFSQYNYTNNNNQLLGLSLRVGYNDFTREVMAEPSIRYEWLPSSRSSLAFFLGRYTQDKFPYYYTQSDLLSEKVLQSGIQGQWKFSKNWNVILNPWYRYRYDLAVASLRPNGRLDLASLLIANPSYAKSLSPEEVAEARALAESGPNPDDLDPVTKTRLENLFGDYDYVYHNSGHAHIGGLEVSMNYKPNTIWSGRFSTELSQGLQQDSPQGIWYPVANHRPWNIRWANLFDLAGNYQVTLQLQHGAGYAYTPYSGTLNDGGKNSSLVTSESEASEAATSEINKYEPIVVGSKNSARFKPYSRLDMRIQKSAHIFSHQISTYFEVWNAFNHPNYFLRDRDTGQLKFSDLNLPFPFLFFGLDYKW